MDFQFSKYHGRDRKFLFTEQYFFRRRRNLHGDRQFRAAPDERQRGAECSAATSVECLVSRDQYFTFVARAFFELRRGTENFCEQQLVADFFQCRGDQQSIQPDASCFRRRFFPFEEESHALKTPLQKNKRCFRTIAGCFPPSFLA